jgi:hypothetical protein
MPGFQLFFNEVKSLNFAQFSLVQDWCWDSFLNSQTLYEKYNTFVSFSEHGQGFREHLQGEPPPRLWN